jgi:hypothetical protein
VDGIFVFQAQQQRDCQCLRVEAQHNSGMQNDGTSSVLANGIAQNLCWASPLTLANNTQHVLHMLTPGQSNTLQLWCQ